MHQNYDAVIQQLRDYIEQDYTLLLPMATIIETGNHVAQNGDGNQRRETSQRLIDLVIDAIEGNAPWTIPTPLFSHEFLREYLQEFPDYAMMGVGLGDLSIIREYDHQCELHSTGRIFIWSLDHHMDPYIREAPEWID